MWEKLASTFRTAERTGSSLRVMFPRFKLLFPNLLLSASAGIQFGRWRSKQQQKLKAGAQQEVLRGGFSSQTPPTHFQGLCPWDPLKHDWGGHGSWRVLCLPVMLMALFRALTRRRCTTEHHSVCFHAHKKPAKSSPFLP